MLPQVGVGEEGDVVAGVPVVGVDNIVKVPSCLAKECVDGLDELQSVLLGRRISKRQGPCQEVVLNVDHEEGGRGRRQDGLDPPLVLCLV